MKKTLWLCMMLVSLLFTPVTEATELVYTPVNPSFGGSPLNGTFLMNQATAQNDHKDSSSSSSYSRDPLESFEESLVRRVLSNLSSSIVDSTFGYDDADLADGYYQVGDYGIEVSGGDGGDVSVSISDVGTGNSTTIVIPSTLNTGQ